LERSVGAPVSRKFDPVEVVSFFLLCFGFMLILRGITRFLRIKTRFRRGRIKFPAPLHAPIKFPPFESDTARPVLSKPVLEGAAYVVDGDTLVIEKTQIRLFGIDAPELNHPYGVRSKRALIALCKGKTVRAVVRECDAHGRTVATCYLPDGRDLSAEMVKIGLAIDWPKFSSGKYRALEVPDVRRKLWLADARQKGRMHVWAEFEARQNASADSKLEP
jgi:micrococcal nuclease